MNKIFILLILIYTVCLFGCRSIMFDKPSDVEVSILNDTIYIPKFDNIECVDTIYVKFTNNSTYNYFFVFNIVDVWFVHEGDRYGKSTPVEGLNVNFRYKKNNQKLEACVAFGYNPDYSLEQLEKDRQLINIESGKTKILKSVLKFPSIVGFGEETQFVENLRFAENIEIIFEPDDVSTLTFMQENMNGLKRNDKLLKIRKEFLLPVRIKCE